MEEGKKDFVFSNNSQKPGNVKIKIFYTNEDSPFETDAIESGQTLIISEDKCKNIQKVTAIIDGNEMEMEKEKLDLYVIHEAGLSLKEPEPVKPYLTLDITNNPNGKKITVDITYYDNKCSVKHQNGVGHFKTINCNSEFIEKMNITGEDDDMDPKKESTSKWEGNTKDNINVVATVHDSK